MQIDTKQPHDSIFKNVFDDIMNTKDLTENEFNDIIIDLKGDNEMPSLAEIFRYLNA